MSDITVTPCDSCNFDNASLVETTDGWYNFTVYIKPNIHDEMTLDEKIVFIHKELLRFVVFSLKQRDGTREKEIDEWLKKTYPDAKWV